MPQHQYSLTLIKHEVNNSVIEQRASDGYINATALCKAGNKEWAGYKRNDRTIRFLNALCADMQICMSELIQEVRGGNPLDQGTWVHPKVAINLAMWVSPEFEVQVTNWVHDWMSGKVQANIKLPSHMNRYIHNDSRVPAGYFSVLQESGIGLFGPLHNLGFVIPDGWVPDISIGKMFCNWLRQNRGIDTDALPTYSHDYLDRRGIVFPKAYPDEYLAEFRRWFRSTWLPVHGVKYFKQRDPDSLAFLDKLPALAAPKAMQALYRAV